MLGRQRSFSPSVPAEAGCLTVAAGVHVFIRGEPKTDTVSWLVGVQIKVYVIATSDL